MPTILRKSLTACPQLPARPPRHDPARRAPRHGGRRGNQDGGERRRISTGTANEVRARQALADFEASLARHPLKLTLDQALDRYITSRTGKYKIFMVLGTGMLMTGYISLFGYHYDTPIWVMSLSMVVIGMGLGQLMQTLTLAAQNSVDAKDIGVATSSTMFFRQMGEIGRAHV